MDITPLIAADRQVIQSYAAGTFRISGQSYDGAVIVTPDKTLAWPARSFDDLTISDFALLDDLGEGFDILLLGCGARGAFLKPDLRRALKAKGLVADAMDTGAACRTYNVLLAEGRRVVAALLPV